MFSLYPSSKLFHPYFEFAQKVKVMGSNPGYLLKSFLFFLQIKDNLRNNINVLVPVKSLSDILTSYGESSKTISYLKVDIEGSELTAIGMNYSCLMDMKIS